MFPHLKGQFGASVLLILLLFGSSSGQAGEECLAQFRAGQEDFILDADESVKDGATFISSPKLDRYKDCVSACCKEPRCNVAFMEKGAEEGLANSCFLFDCLYKKKYVCRFVRKKGFMNFILDSVYDSYLQVDVPPSKRNVPCIFYYNKFICMLVFFFFFFLSRNSDKTDLVPF